MGFLILILSIIAIIIHLYMVRTYGVQYLPSLAPMKERDRKDVLVRVPRWNVEHSSALNRKRKQVPTNLHTKILSD
ncbi:spore germination protein [Paenibacillus sp. WC2504]|uniref:spore germination protein n=1 Tax=Paenibacillus sp. WC2504 TaxID=3461403 RepID=UPI00404603B6